MNYNKIKQKEQSEYSTFGRNEFRNAHTGEMQKSVTVDWTPKGSSQVGYLREPIVMENKEIEEEVFEPASYIRIETEKELPATDDKYFTSSGYISFKNEKWYLGDLGHAAPLWWLKQINTNESSM